MEIIGGSILALSIISVLWQLVRTRRRARNGEIIVPPFFAGLLIFSLFVLGVVIFGVSPLHLLWLFPVSYGIGTVLLLFPVVQKIVMTFLLVLANPKAWEEEEKGQVTSHRDQKHARRPSGSKRRKR